MTVSAELFVTLARQFSHNPPLLKVIARGQAVTHAQIDIRSALTRVKAKDLEILGRLGELGRHDFWRVSIVARAPLAIDIVV